jgi:hypothetical protein
MQTQRLRLVGLGRWGVVLVLALCIGGASQVFADPSTSANYSVDQAQFGSGSQQNACSATYCADSSAGDTVVGSASSASYSAQFGSETSNVPLLEVITSGGIQDLGVLDTTHTGTAVMGIKVRSYLSAGYIIQLTGSAPTTGAHTLDSLTTPTSTHQGAEQFGVNLVANTTPAIGANPVQQPSSDFSSGTVTSDYANQNLFKYIDGDVVGGSDKSSGETDYTLSMILNVSNVTPGGRYNGVFSAVVVPLY